jgi:predicted transcriptional regulator
MKKDMLFEAIVVLLLIILIFILYVMVTNSSPSASEEWNLSGMIGSTSSYYYGNMFIGADGTLYTVDGKNIHAADVNGRDRWSLEIPYLINEYRDLIVYGNVTWVEFRAASDNGTLYIDLMAADSSQNQELLAVSADGKLLWGKSYTYNYFPENLGARDGLLYVKFYNNTIIYDKDGAEVTLIPENIPEGLFNRSISKSNITYSYQPISAVNASEPVYLDYETVEELWLAIYNQSTGRPRMDSDKVQKYLGNRTIDQLDAILINANDTRTGKTLWNYTLQIEKHTVTVNESNCKSLTIDYNNIENDNKVSPAEWYKSRNITYGTKVIGSWAYTNLIQTDDILYVSYWTYSYEVPAFFNRSNCTYAGGIYAIDNSGNLLWSKSTSSRVIAMQVNNGTVYYGTDNGKIFSTKVDITAGFVLTAFLYLFIRFFLVGAVTRVRGRIDSNKNRNTVLNFIVGNPGVSLYEISKSLGMNMGTARYHLMILGMNHRISSYKADDKYVRYFTNSGSYSKEQQLIISLMRRDSIKKLLNKLLDKPGMSNMELAKELGVQDSSTIRQIKELLEKGILLKRQTQNGKLVYSINNSYREPIVFAIERLNNN